MYELIKYFDWVSLLAVSIATSFFLAVVNQTQGGKSVHNAIIAIPASLFFSSLVVHWELFYTQWQLFTFQFSVMVMVSCLISVSRGQDAVDSLISLFVWIMKSIVDKVRGSSQ